MAEPKTKASGRSVSRFLGGVKDEKRREDCLTLSRIMSQATKSQPRMWGTSILGFGTYRYRHASGRAGEWFLTGFYPRKQNLTLYIMSGFEAYDGLLKKLGKYKTGKACLYIKTLDDVYLPTLGMLIRQSVKHMARGR